MNNTRAVIIFIGLSVILLIGIGLLPKLQVPVSQYKYMYHV